METKTFTTAVREEIRAELARRRLGQHVLVEAWGISQPAVAIKLAGRSVLNTNHVEQAATALGYNVFDFVARAGQNAKQIA